MWAADRGLCVLRLVWQEAYECDEPTIDRQHREIFELANALFDVSFTSESPTEAFGAALEKLMVHIARHFIDEEALLVQHGYKNIELHRAEHAGLLARAMELKASTLAGKTSLGELVEFLAKTVVADHIFKDDWDYFPLFKKQTA
jgi:hemerythrin